MTRLSCAARLAARAAQGNPAALILLYQDRLRSCPKLQHGGHVVAASLSTRRQAGFAAAGAQWPVRTLEPFINTGRSGRGTVSLMVGLTDRKAFKQTQ
ncbi:Exonuclease SbcC [Paraburkholderia unamae]|nr:Exonuclease SbcC [Paraburkholderia unamae]